MGYFGHAVARGSIFLFIDVGGLLHLFELGGVLFEKGGIGELDCLEEVRRFECFFVPIEGGLFEGDMIYKFDYLFEYCSFEYFRV